MCALLAFVVCNLKTWINTLFCLIRWKSLLQNQPSSNSHNEAQREKMEKLESECVKLSRTQALAEVIHCVPNEKYQHVMMTGKISTTNIASSFVLQTKLAVLEQRLLKEEHERQLVQKKADKVSLHVHKYIYMIFLLANFTSPMFSLWWHFKKKLEWALHDFELMMLICLQLLEEMEASLHLPVPAATEEIKKKTKKTPKVVYFCI